MRQLIGSSLVALGIGLEVAQRLRTLGYRRSQRRLRRRRRSLAYSFTGEKVTGQQVSRALERIHAEFSSLGDESFLTCVPSLAAEDGLPRYLLVRVELGHAHGGGDEAMPAAAASLDASLGDMNGECRATRDSGRIGPMPALHASRIGLRGEPAGREQPRGHDPAATSHDA